MLDAFRDHAFRGHNLSLVTALRDIAAEYAAQGMRLTVRQLYYQCVARGWIENNEREYQKIIRLLTDAREAGLFDWDAIEDRGREVVMRPCWRSPAEILEAAASSYHEDRWVLQDVRVVVILEKAALAGIVNPACKDLYTIACGSGLLIGHLVLRDRQGADLPGTRAWPGRGRPAPRGPRSKRSRHDAGPTGLVVAIRQATRGRAACGAEHGPGRSLPTAAQPGEGERQAIRCLSPRVRRPMLGAGRLAAGEAGAATRETIEEDID